MTDITSGTADVPSHEGCIGHHESYAFVYVLMGPSETYGSWQTCFIHSASVHTPLGRPTTASLIVKFPTCLPIPIYSHAHQYNQYLTGIHQGAA